VREAPSGPIGSSGEPLGTSYRGEEEVAVGGVAGDGEAEEDGHGGVPGKMQAPAEPEGARSEIGHGVKNTEREGDEDAEAGGVGALAGEDGVGPGRGIRWRFRGRRPR